MIKLVKKHEGIELPVYKTDGSSGADVRADSILKVFKGDIEVKDERFKKIKEGFKNTGYIKLRPFERILFGTGLILSEMDKSLEIQVRSRSGKALKQGLVVINSPGTVDADYKGEIGVIIYNSAPFLNKIEKNERIAQLVVAKVEKPGWMEVQEVLSSDRGDGGFGSTGKH